MLLDSIAWAWLDRSVKPRLVLVVWGLWLVTTLGLADDGGGWTLVDSERGITSSKRDQPGCCLPSFRGQGRVAGNVLQVLSLLMDVEAVPKWAYGVDKATLLKRDNSRSELVYLYSDVPWPVRDRDMIVRRELDVVKGGEEFTMSLRCEPKAKAERDGIVRVKSCRSTFHLRKVDATHTEIDYVMSLDPGGHLPEVVNNFLAKAVPFKTLVAIEDSAHKREGQYEAQIKAWRAAL
jgi:hypothetical protein